MGKQETYWEEFVEFRKWIECTHEYEPAIQMSAYYDTCKKCGFSLPKLEKKIQQLLGVLNEQ